MRTLVVFVAVFLILAVLHCEGKRKRRAVNSTDGSCIHKGKIIEDGKSITTKQDPCKKVTCRGGEKIIEPCGAEARMDFEERKADGRKGKGGKKGEDGKKKKGGKKERNGKKGKEEKEE